MAKYFSYNMRKSAHSVLSYIVLAAILFLPNTISAQKNGQITGRIFDSATKEYLPGANVVLKGTTFGAATDRSGLYRIVNIPPGTYELVVSYIGFENQSVNITIGTQGFTVNQDIGIKASDVQMTEIEITGMLQGQTKALNIQKSSDKIMNAVSEEQMEKFPDINAAEVLQRIPGVSIQRDQGDGRYIQIRGTEARLNNVQINGSTLPSPEGELRQVMMDVIPADQLSSIEVIKAATPDLDGSAIGGTVNLITRSALDYEKDIFNVTAGAGYSDISGKGLYQGGLNYGTRLGENKNVGIMFSASYLRSDKGSDNNQMEWGEIETPAGDLPWGLTTLELRDYIVNRERLGFTGGIEYKPDNDTKLSLKGIYNHYSDYENRHTLGIAVDKGDYNSATSISDAEIEKHLKNRRQVQNLFSLTGKGEHNLGDLFLDYALTYGISEELELDHISPTFVLDKDVNLTLNLADTDIPLYTITNRAAGYELDPANYEFDEIEFQDNSTTNKEFTAAVNLKIPYNFAGYQAELKFGGKLDMKKKDRDDKVWEYGWEGDDPVLLSQFVGDYKPENFLGGKYNLGSVPDPKKIESFFNQNKNGLLEGEVNREDTDGGSFDADEDIYAAYAMTTVNFDDLMLLAGFRYEMTGNKYNGNEVIFDDEGDYASTLKRSADNSYSNFLPMIHLRYKLSPQTNFRAAFTNGIARPNYYDLVPYRIVFEEDEEMAIGNPTIKPTTAYSFDLMLEHYFEGIGIVSGGVFYKGLSDIIFESVYEEVGGQYDGYEVYQSVNGGSATLFGFEVNWQQQLSFLPGFLNGLGIFVNYTYTTSNADLPGRDGATLPGQAGNVGNIALSYQKYGFSAQLSLNYHSKYIDIVGEDSQNDIYYDDHVQLDFSANQQILSGLSAYVQILNLTDAPLRYYIGDTKRPIQREFYSWWVQAGFKFNLN